MAAQPVSGVVPIAEQRGDRVLVELPLVGFPDGFRLRPGDIVSVLNIDGGPAVYPHNEFTVVDQLPSESGNRLAAAGRQLEVQPATVRMLDTPGDRYAIFLVENASADVQPQVISIRRVP